MTLTTVRIRVGRATLTGDLIVPARPRGLIVFAHGSGSSRMSPRNREVANGLVADDFATLLFDLLTRDEELAERLTRHLRFDIPLLADRLVETVRWTAERPELANLPLGLFGASTGAAAALIAASRLRQMHGPEVRAIVSRGGRPDLAGSVLRQVAAPTLLIAGGEDVEVLAINRLVLSKLMAPAALQVIPDAGHLFDEPGALHAVTEAASRWFRSYLVSPALYCDSDSDARH